MLFVFFVQISVNAFVFQEAGDAGLAEAEVLFVFLFKFLLMPLCSRKPKTSWPKIRRYLFFMFQIFECLCNPGNW